MGIAFLLFSQVPAALSVVTVALAVSVPGFLALQPDNRVTRPAAARPRSGGVHARGIWSSGAFRLWTTVQWCGGYPTRTYAGGFGWFQVHVTTGSDLRQQHRRRCRPGRALLVVLEKRERLLPRLAPDALGPT